MNLANLLISFLCIAVLAWMGKKLMHWQIAFDLPKLLLIRILCYAVYSVRGENLGQLANLTNGARFTLANTYMYNEITDDLPIHLLIFSMLFASSAMIHQIFTLQNFPVYGIEVLLVTINYISYTIKLLKPKPPAVYIYVCTYC